MSSGMVAGSTIFLPVHSSTHSAQGQLSRSCLKGILASRPPGATLGYSAKAPGWYILHVRVTAPGGGAYRLVVAKSR